MLCRGFRGYISIWILVVSFGQIKVVKMATLILAQVSTALYLVGTYILNFIPIQYLNDHLTKVENFNLVSIIYGHDARKFVEIALESIIYPIIVSALLTYIIAEYRDIKHNGAFFNH